MQEFRSFLLAVLLYAGTTALGIVGYLYAGTINHPGLGWDIFGLFAIAVLFLVGFRYLILILTFGIDEKIYTQYMKWW